MVKITEYHGTDIDMCGSYEIEAKRDGQLLLGFYARDLWDCPEDASLGRDMDFAYKAIEFFKLGQEIGKSGEEVMFESFNVSKEDKESDNG